MSIQIRLVLNHEILCHPICNRLYHVNPKVFVAAVKFVTEDSGTILCNYENCYISW